MKPWPADNIDPIEELVRIIGKDRERDAQEEGRLDDLARGAAPEIKRRPRRLGRS
jgi:hypothetical protein